MALPGGHTVPHYRDSRILLNPPTTIIQEPQLVLSARVALFSGPAAPVLGNDIVLRDVVAMIHFIEFQINGGVSLSDFRSRLYLLD